MSQSNEVFLSPTQESGRDFLRRGVEGEVVMLNLGRFREVADYSASPDLAPPDSRSGEEAYNLYLDLARPFLQELGGSIDFLGSGGPWFIGPPEERWDIVMLVRHRSVEAFMSFASNDEYAKILGHRTAALADSRLLPVQSKP